LAMAIFRVCWRWSAQFFRSRFLIHSLKQSSHLPKFNGPIVAIHCYQQLSRHCSKSKSILITVVARCTLICSATRFCSKKLLTLKSIGCDCINFCSLFTFVSTIIHASKLFTWVCAQTLLFIYFKNMLLFAVFSSYVKTMLCWFLLFFWKFFADFWKIDLASLV
jgi:hypothetical protein